MFRWRRKSDGFEWHKYVRTTIKLRRNERKKRIENIKYAAARKVQDAGVAGASAGRAGVAAAAHGSSVGLAAARRGLAVGMAASGRGLRSGSIIAGRGARTGLSIVCQFLGALPGATARAFSWLTRRAGPYLAEAWLIFLDLLVDLLIVIGRGMATLRRALQHPGVAPMLGGAALTIALYALIRLVWLGADRTMLMAVCIAAAIGVVAAIALRDPVRLPGATAVATAGRAVWSPFGWLIDRAADGLRRTNLPLRGVAIAAATVVAIFSVGYAGQALWNNAASVNPLNAFALVTGSATQTLTGRARTISGDTLSIAGRRIRLSSIEAPELAQVCRTSSGRAWRCGIAARSRLSRLLRRGSATCKVTKTDQPRLFDGSCTVRGVDVAKQQVRRGYAFAASGLISSTYGGEEQKAREARRGIWRGKVDRPDQFRTSRWKRAKSRAPDGCPIKGRIVRGGKIYVLPWSPDYRRVRIRTRRGERWFCSEKDAIAAGWHRAPTG